MIDPGSYVEDWRAIEEGVLAKSYPAEEDPELRWQIKRVLVDSGGAEGVTTNAYEWWRELRRRRRHRLVSLVKGGSPPSRPRRASDWN